MAGVLFLASLPGGNSAFAGTTGNLRGVVLSGKAPVAGARITVSSPSETTTTVTDAHGAWTLLSLIPDSYVLSVERQGYDTVLLSRVDVVADQTQSLTLPMHQRLLELAHVDTRAGEGLVQPGITADQYSVSPAVAQAAQLLGGGRSLNQAYSAIGTVPGVLVPGQQSGWAQSVLIRGAGQDQTGYEYDGVPMNRPFDNLPTGTLSTLGEQELQVYTGGAPASSAATGLGGFINQVVRTGTYPGFASLQVDGGAPTMYQNYKLEVGGAAPNRNFTYYLGFLDSKQDFRYIDQFDGKGNTTLAAPLGLPPPPFFTGVAPACPKGAASIGCYAFAPYSLEFPDQTTDREVVGNFHFAIPHHNDGGKDDVQFLYTNSAMRTEFPDSANDLISYGALPAGTRLPYPTAVTFPNGTTFGESASGLAAVPYQFPNAAPAGAAFINPNQRDGIENDASILKLQYQKNFGTNAYARVYGYSMYSDEFVSDPNESSASFIVPAPLAPDFEVATHTNGFGLQLADQLSERHLLQFTTNYLDASTLRWNNQTISNRLSTPATNLVDGAGNCYDAAGQRATCNANPADPTYGTFGNPTPFAPPAGSPAALAGAKWIVTTPGQQGPYNTVAPTFASFALTDNWRPNSKLDVNAGMRLENFSYAMASTNTPGQNFWAQAAQNELCYNAATFQFDSTPQLTCPTGEVHPNGQNGAMLYTNTYPSTLSATVMEPRIGGAYTLDPDTVLRASYGRYATPASSDTVQYVTYQPNTPGYFFGKFVASGLASSPSHAVRPAVANDYDFSLEKHFKGTDMSLKVTPFYNATLDTLQNVFIDQQSQYVSPINAGAEHSMGVELQFRKGDFHRDGFAMLLSYTYTNALMRYQNIGGGSVNPIDQINTSISAYNALTKAGGGAPCYTPSVGGAPGTPLATCAGNPAAIQNPYYNQSPQGLLNRNGWYTPFAVSPAVNGAATVSPVVPHVVSLVLNYKKKRFTVTPSFQMFAGQRYGSPLSQIGWNPASCAANQMGIPSAVAAGRGQYADWTTCSGSLNIPNYETGAFDAMGAYTEPIALQGNIQMSYDLSKKIKLTLAVANLFNTCFGGSKEPWTAGGAGVCGYGLDFTGLGQGISNFYNGASPNDAAANGGATANAYNAHAYTAQDGNALPFINPMEIYFGAQIRL